MRTYLKSTDFLGNDAAPLNVQLSSNKNKVVTTCYIANCILRSLCREAISDYNEKITLMRNKVPYSLILFHPSPYTAYLL